MYDTRLFPCTPTSMSSLSSSNPSFLLSLEHLDSTPSAVILHQHLILLSTVNSFQQPLLTIPSNHRTYRCQLYCHARQAHFTMKSTSFLVLLPVDLVMCAVAGIPTVEQDSLVNAPHPQQKATQTNPGTILSPVPSMPGL